MVLQRVQEAKYKGKYMSTRNSNSGTTRKQQKQMQLPLVCRKQTRPKQLKEVHQQYLGKEQVEAW